LAEVAHARGDAAAERALYEKSLAIGRELGDQRVTASSLYHLANLAVSQDETETARRLYVESLTLWSAQADQEKIAACLDGLAAVCGVERSWQAARLLGAAAAIREALGTLQVESHSSSERPDAARATLGEKDYMAAWSEGYAMTLEQAIECALNASPED
jgi:hypothetical protein